MEKFNQIQLFPVICKHLHDYVLQQKNNNVHICHLLTAMQSYRLPSLL